MRILNLEMIDLSTTPIQIFDNARGNDNRLLDIFRGNDVLSSIPSCDAVGHEN
jgi:hypothetical protein